MKKISFLLVLLVMLFSFKVPVLGKNISTIDLENLNVHITGSSTSVIELSFETEEPLINLVIWMNYQIGDNDVRDLIYAERKEQSSRCEVISRGELKDNGHYYYCFKLTSVEKISTFDFIFNYEVEGDSISQKVYVTNGNPNFESAVFSPLNAVIIGFTATLAAALGTYAIVKMSEKNVQISDEEE